MAPLNQQVVIYSLQSDCSNEPQAEADGLQWHAWGVTYLLFKKMLQITTNVRISIWENGASNQFKKTHMM